MYLYNTNYYQILKYNLQLLHKLYPREFKVAHQEISVLKFTLIEIDTSSPTRFVFCTEAEILFYPKGIKYNKSTSEQ